jgi:hypothetical protein
MRTRFSIPASLLLLLACSDDPPAAQPVSPPTPTPEPTPTQPAPEPPPPPLECAEATLKATLAKLDNVSEVKEQDCGDYVDGKARCFSFVFSQKLDHKAGADGARFKHHGQLIHRTCNSDVTFVDNGYALPQIFYEMEPSLLSGSNTLSLEHRFQGNSLPDPANRKWATLSVENGAADMHEVITSFKKLYRNKWVTTGASKGGITAVYHRFFYPNDVDGTVGYVAPASRAREDARYQDRLESGPFPAACATDLRAFQVGALSQRRPAFVSMLVNTYGVQRDQANYALESYMARFDWGFWQGEGNCGDVPKASDSDAVHVSFFERELQRWGGPFVGPATRAELSGAALSYEWAWQQGFALQVGRHLTPSLFETTAVPDSSHHATFAQIVPGERVPAYDGSATERMREWVRTSADRLVLIYGEIDPWTGGALDAPTRPSSGRFIAPGVSHGANLQALESSEQTQAIAAVAAMYGKSFDMHPSPSKTLRIRHAHEALARQEAQALLRTFTVRR